MEVAPFGVKVCTLEPGGIRTNWARRAVQSVPDLLSEYEATVGSFLKIVRGLEGRSEGGRGLARGCLRLLLQRTSFSFQRACARERESRGGISNERKQPRGKPVGLNTT
jgi:hypothetical protein